MKVINVFNSVSAYGVNPTVILYTGLENFPRLPDNICEILYFDEGDTWLIAAPHCELFPLTKAVNIIRDPAIFGRRPIEVCHEGLDNFPKSHTDLICEILDFQSWHMLAAPSCHISCPVNITRAYKLNFATHLLKQNYNENKALEILHRGLSTTT